MYTTDERLHLLNRRVKRHSRMAQNRRLSVLAAFSGALFIAIIAVVAGAPSGGELAAAPGLYGAMLLYEGAGGYVLVGVIAFITAVIITVLCLKSREKQNTNEHNEEEN